MSKTCYGPSWEQGKSVGSPLPEEKESAETTFDDLVTVRIPCPLSLWWEEIKKSIPVKEQAMGVRSLKIYLFYSDLTDNKSN